MFCLFFQEKKEEGKQKADKLNAVSTLYSVFFVKLNCYGV